MQHARFVPLQKIDWRKEYHLARFIHKLTESSNKVKIKDPQLKSLFLHNLDLRSIFIDIALIVLRINEDGSRINRMEELYEISSSRELTDSEAEKLENLHLSIDLFDLDIRSLLIYIQIFMDKLARFLSLIMNKKEEKLRNGSFFDFKKDLVKLRGKEIKDLNQLISGNTKWFKKVKDLRDDFVVHQPGVSGVMVFRNGKASATLTTRKGIEKEPRYIVMGSQARDISMDEIDDVLSQLKKLLFGLDDFLCSHINLLPIKVSTRPCNCKKPEKSSIS